MPFTIHHGEVTAVFPNLTGRFHAVLCDPPYGLEFMGKEWDAPHKATSFPKPGNLGGFADGNKPSFARQGNFGQKYQAWVTTWAESLLPLLYPGALVLCFGGTRTWHRLAAGLEDAGFQMWDTLMWLHGQGFPKAQDISKLIDKANGNERKVTAAGSEASAPWAGRKTCALKPAWEPVLCFRSPSQGKSYAEVAQMFGSGALYVDGSRILTDDKLGGGAEKWTRHAHEGWQRPWMNDPEAQARRAAECKASVEKGETLGRYPANLALDEESAAILDEQSGTLTSGNNPSKRSADKHQRVYAGWKGEQCLVHRGTNSGGASRFFYTAKADQTERHSLNEVVPSKGNDHPTVKPIDLCRWLATLLLPPESVKPRRLLVPFSGSGSEMIGALQAGWDEVIGIDQDAGYCEIVPARIEHHVGLFAQVG